MKKYLKMIPIMLYPYAYIICFFVLNEIVNNHSEWQQSRLYLFLICALPILFHALCFFGAILFLIQCVNEKWTAKQATGLVLLIKCIHIPAYILHFLFGIFGFVLSVWGMPIVAFAILIDLITIFFSGLCAIGSMVQMKKNSVVSTVVAVLLSIGSFLYCIDIVIVAVCFILCVEKEKKMKKIMISNPIGLNSNKTLMN